MRREGESFAKAIFDCGSAFVKRFLCNFLCVEANDGVSRGKNPRNGSDLVVMEAKKWSGARCVIARP
jgi:hypothetical protein